MEMPFFKDGSFCNRDPFLGFTPSRKGSCLSRITFPSYSRSINYLAIWTFPSINRSHVSLLEERDTGPPMDHERQQGLERIDFIWLTTTLPMIVRSKCGASKSALR